jgi:hypothetical protein
MLRWFSPLPDSIKTRLWDKKYLVRDEMPSNLKPISLRRFLYILLNYELSGFAPKGYYLGQKYLRGILLYFYDEKVSVLVQQVMLNGALSVKIYQVDYCTHKYRAWDATRDERPGPGRCFSVTVCDICGRRDERDSS